MCDCIKVNYIPIGKEPVVTEVTSNGLFNGKNYYEFNAPVYNLGCDTIKVTYKLNSIIISFILEDVTYTYNVPKYGEFNGKNQYLLEIGDPEIGYGISIRWINIPTPFWRVEIYLSDTLESAYTNPTDNEIPNFNIWNYQIGTVLTNLDTTTTDAVTVEVDKSSDQINDKNWFPLVIGDYYSGVMWVNNIGTFRWEYNLGVEGAYLSEDTPCPFGTFTIEEGSIFESFVVEPVTSQLFTVSWDGIKWDLITFENVIWKLTEDTDCPIGIWTNNDDTIYFSGFRIEECNPRKTITYSKVAEGWNSFWSYQPDWMTEMNSIFYTFKNGELWRHNNNTTRNNFYGQQYSSTIRGIFNNDPLTVKMFNTLSLNSTHAWSADIYTNITAGSMNYSYFVEKENQWFSYIRRFDNTIDIKALSTQGIGTPTVVTTVSSTVVTTTFGVKLDSSISIGDKIYKNSGGNLVLIGKITALTPTVITIDISIGGTPTTTDFLICVKNSQTESFGARGYYMNVYLTNELTEQVKLFAIGTSVFKSFL